MSGLEKVEQEGKDPHFDDLMIQVNEQFKAAQTYEEATLRLTTNEVFEKLQAFYPSHTYTSHMVYLALKELGYVYADPFQEMNYIWLFR